MQRIAIVGSGISGLAVAHELRDKAHLTLFEAADYFGGHTHTVDVRVPTPTGEVTHGVDTGFLVFNERTYPQLIALFKSLQIPCAVSDMSFSVKIPGCDLEWGGSSLASLFAQKRNLWRPRFLWMLREIARFNQIGTALARNPSPEIESLTVEQFLNRHQFSEAFQQWYLLPMIGSIWSCSVQQMQSFPVQTLLRFCDNHGLMQVSERPRWFTVAGGARQYVEKIVATIHDARLSDAVRGVRRISGSNHVEVRTDHGTERFDAVVMACHSDQVLTILDAPNALEQQVLSAIRYQSNQAVLHTDERLLPTRRSAWAAWNYESNATGSSQLQEPQPQVCLHYYINQLQPLPFDTPVIVSLNPITLPRAERVQGVFEYDHPIFDQAAIQAQKRVPEMQGRGGVWFCGAWTGYGFHEDGLRSGLEVARLLQAAESTRP
jgi:uncharacterized protein